MSEKEFEHDDAKLFLEALERPVRMDAKVTIVKGQGKLRAYCKEVNSNLQFPRALRVLGREFLADIKCSQDNEGKGPTGQVFWRVIKGSIRDKDGKVVG
jgi:hypothetical protein